MSEIILEVDNLTKHFFVEGGLFRRGIPLKAVDHVSFKVQKGETLGLVGESGCGKSTLAYTILRLEAPTSGQVFFEGQEVTAQAIKTLRQKMQIIFQDPTSSLDPRIPVGESVAEGLEIHNLYDEKERFKRVCETLSKVGIDEGLLRRYPHELSGGQRQRIGIARALVLNPSLIICDEPVSALDVSIQSQVLNLLRALQKEFGLTYLFVAHNLSVVQHISNRIAVMYLGKIVELAERKALFSHPFHPYTKALKSAIPIPDPTIKPNRILLQGDVPKPTAPPTGCHFHPRCWLRRERAICAQEEPPFEEKAPGHRAACHFATEVAAEA